MTRNDDLGLEDAARRTAAVGADAVAEEMFRTLWGLPKFADERRLRRLEVFRVVARRTLPDGPEAVAAAARLALNGAVGDPAAPRARQAVQRDVQYAALGLGAPEIRTRLGQAELAAREAESADTGADTDDLLDVLDGEDDWDLGGGPDHSEQWRHAEWQRLLDIVTAGGHPLYEPGLDRQLAVWSAQHHKREQQAQADRADADRATRAAQAARAGAVRRERADELHLHLHLDSDAGRRVRAWAQAHGVTPAEVVHQLLQRADDGPAGGVCVEEFTPMPSAAPAGRRQNPQTPPAPTARGFRDGPNPSAYSEDYAGPALDW